MKIWLDDTRTPPDGSWKWLKTAEDVIDWFRLNHDVWDVEVLSLDNDLGEGCDEGYKVLDWLEKKEILRSELRCAQENPSPFCQSGSPQAYGTKHRKNGWK